MKVTERIKTVAADLDARRDQMVDLLARLVKTESPSDDFAAVNHFASLLAHEMELLGLQPSLQSIPNSPDLVECYHGEGGKPVMLLGHMDTVWPMGTLKRRPMRVDGNRLYGPGSFDMKAGIVAALYAVRALGDSCPRVHLFMTPQEEVSGLPYLALLEQRARESCAVIGLEPAWPGGAVKTERKGCGRIIIRAHGRSAHAGSEPERGVNAIMEICHQIERLRALQSELADGVTLNVGVIRGGTRRNVVPDSAEIDVDLRFKRLRDGDDAVRRVTSLTPILPGATIDVSAQISAPPLERTDSVMRLFGVAARVEEILGRTLQDVSTGGVSEVCYAAACGVPAIDGFGADGDGAHAEDEHVYLPSLPQRAALLAGTLLLLQQEMASGQ